MPREHSVKGSLEAETADAILVRNTDYDHKPLWFPKSHCAGLVRRVEDDETIVIFIIPDWLHKAKVSEQGEG